jgi:hypothetical protein
MTPTPSELAMGRFMRADDHGADGDGPAGGGDGDASGKGEGAGTPDDGDQSSVLGGAQSDDGAGDQGGDQSKGSEGGSDDGKPNGSAEGADTVPEAYDLKLTVPGKDDDGKDIETQIEMDKVLLDKATPVLKELGLSNDKANKLAPLVLDVQARMAEQQAEDHKAMTAQWARDAEKDPEIGGKKWSETQALAAKALDHYGAPKGSEFRQLLDDTGLGNHPTMIAMFRKVGASIAEDTKLERDTTNPQGKKDRLETLYPDDVPKK